MNIEKSAERIVILNSATGQVLIRFVPLDMIENDANEIVEFFAIQEGFKESDCQYMVVNDDDFIDDTTVFQTSLTDKAKFIEGLLFDYDLVETDKDCLHNINGALLEATNYKN